MSYSSYSNSCLCQVQQKDTAAADHAKWAFFMSWEMKWPKVDISRGTSFLEAAFRSSGWTGESLYLKQKKIKERVKNSASGERMVRTSFIPASITEQSFCVGLHSSHAFFNGSLISVPYCGLPRWLETCRLVRLVVLLRSPLEVVPVDGTLHLISKRMSPNICHILDLDNAYLWS